MRIKSEKTAPAVAAAESGNGQILVEGFKPTDDIITSFEAKQGTIAFFLSRSHKNALTRTELSQITGMHWRKVTLQINRERKAGAPILSDTSGYWLAENQRELKQCAARLHKRATEIHRTAKALERLSDGK